MPLPVTIIPLVGPSIIANRPTTGNTAWIPSTTSTSMNRLPLTSTTDTEKAILLSAINARKKLTGQPIPNEGNVNNNVESSSLLLPQQQRSTPQSLIQVLKNESINPSLNNGTGNDITPGQYTLLQEKRLQEYQQDLYQKIVQQQQQKISSSTSTSRNSSKPYVSSRSRTPNSVRSNTTNHTTESIRNNQLNHHVLSQSLTTSVDPTSNNWPYGYVQTATGTFPVLPPPSIIQKIKPPTNIIPNTITSTEENKTKVLPVNNPSTTITFPPPNIIETISSSSMTNDPMVNNIKDNNVTNEKIVTKSNFLKLRSRTNQVMPGTINTEKEKSIENSDPKVVAGPPEMTTKTISIPDGEEITTPAVKPVPMTNPGTKRTLKASEFLATIHNKGTTNNTNIIEEVQSLPSSSAVVHANSVTSSASVASVKSEISFDIPIIDPISSVTHTNIESNNNYTNNTDGDGENAERNTFSVDPSVQRLSTLSSVVTVPVEEEIRELLPTFPVLSINYVDESKETKLSITNYPVDNKETTNNFYTPSTLTPTSSSSSSDHYPNNFSSSLLAATSFAKEGAKMRATAFAAVHNIPLSSSSYSSSSTSISTNPPASGTTSRSRSVGRSSLSSSVHFSLPPSNLSLPRPDLNAPSISHTLSIDEAIRHAANRVPIPSHITASLLPFNNSTVGTVRDSSAPLTSTGTFTSLRSRSASVEPLDILKSGLQGLRPRKGNESYDTLNLRYVSSGTRSSNGVAPRGRSTVRTEPISSILSIPKDLPSKDTTVSLESPPHGNRSVSRPLSPLSNVGTNLNLTIPFSPSRPAPGPPSKETVSKSNIYTSTVPASVRRRPPPPPTAAVSTTENAATILQPGFLQTTFENAFAKMGVTMPDYVRNSLLSNSRTQDLEMNVTEEGRKSTPPLPSNGTVLTTTTSSPQSEKLITGSLIESLVDTNTNNKDNSFSDCNNVNDTNSNENKQLLITNILGPLTNQSLPFPDPSTVDESLQPQESNSLQKNKDTDEAVTKSINVASTEKLDSDSLNIDSGKEKDKNDENDEDDEEEKNDFRTALSPGGLDRLMYSLRAISHNLHEQFTTDIRPRSENRTENLPNINDVSSTINESEIEKITILSTEEKVQKKKLVPTATVITTAMTPRVSFSENSLIVNEKFSVENELIITENRSPKEVLREQLEKKHPSLPPFGFGWFMMENYSDDTVTIPNQSFSATVGTSNSASKPSSFFDSGISSPSFNLKKSRIIENGPLSISFVENTENNGQKKEKYNFNDSSSLSDQTGIISTSVFPTVGRPTSDQDPVTVLQNLREAIRTLNSTNLNIFDNSIQGDNSTNFDQSEESLEFSYLSGTDNNDSLNRRNLAAATNSTPPILPINNTNSRNISTNTIPLSSSVSRTIPRPLSLRINPTPRK